MVLWPISFIESVESRVLKFYIIFYPPNNGKKIKLKDCVWRISLEVGSKMGTLNFWYFLFLHKLSRVWKVTFDVEPERSEGERRIKYKNILEVECMPLSAKCAIPREDRLSYASTWVYLRPS